MAQDNNHHPVQKTGQKAIDKKSDVDQFLQRVANTPARLKTDGAKGRLIFAMDATASRQPMWDRAATIQGQMFHETAQLGSLEIQLVFYRGFGEFKVSKWTHEEPVVQRWMRSVQCYAGETQLGKVLSHAANETKRSHVDGLIFVGDCFEEDIDLIGKRAGELGVLGIPAFMFLEGDDPLAHFAFKEIARLSGGACCQFDTSSPQTLRDLLAAVAVYATGGRKALLTLANAKGGQTLQIARQITGKG